MTAADLTEDECRFLLASQIFGRVGLTSGALPVILPVEYVYDDGVITFRTEPDSKLRAAEHGDVLAFEVDGYDAGSGQGWSVHVLGRATVLTRDHEITALPTLDQSRGPARHHYVRLHCEVMTGRRLVSSRL